MAGARRRLVLGLLSVSLALGGAVGGIDRAVAQDPPLAAEPEAGSWLKRTLRRYFVNTQPTGHELDGQALRLVDRYRSHAGKRIEVIIVHPVERFDRDPQSGGRQFLAGLTQPLRAYTRDSVIRDYLLFRRGEELDPFRLADSERLLRALEFIGDVKLIVVPLEGAGDAVAVVVELRDRWPVGAAGSLRGIDRYRADLYHTNVGGLGVRFDNELIYRGDSVPELGYRGQLRQGNLSGSFIGLNLEFEDSWRELQHRVAAERAPSHPDIRAVGGAVWQRTDDRDNDGVPRRFEDVDLWVGDVLTVGDDDSPDRASRSVLVPSLRFARRGFLARPIVRADTNRSYHNRRQYLAGVTFSRFRFYKTSYLYRMGETEDVPAGFAVKVSSGYEAGEFGGRTGGFLQTWLTTVQRRGSILFLGLDVGGFQRAGVFEDGSLAAAVSYVGPLSGGDRYRYRLFVDLRYHRGLQRIEPDKLALGDGTGLRGMENDRVRGDQRLVLNCETRLFTPWSLLGFRFMAFAFADVGVVAGEHESLWREKIYPSVGLGLRVNNPDLVFSVTELRLALLSGIDDNELLIGLRTGGVAYPERQAPGVVPGGFEFR